MFAKHKYQLLPQVIADEHFNPTPLPQDGYMTWADEAAWANPDRPTYGVPLSRADQKALDREIPWREIIQRGSSYNNAFGEAAVAEWLNWCSFDPIRPLGPEETERIFADPRLKRRILRARAAYRDRNCGQGTLSAKCRLVLVGCNDPDLFDLFRNSPVGTRTSFYLVSVVCSSGSSFTSGRWRLANADVVLAFLQGTPEPRTEPLYIKSPRGPILEKMGIWPADYYAVTGNIYGLANASWTFCTEVLKRMDERDFRQHSLDPMLFMHRTGGELHCLVLFHVDDALITWSPDYDIGNIENMFVWAQ